MTISTQFLLNMTNELGTFYMVLVLGETHVGHSVHGSGVDPASSQHTPQITRPGGIAF